MCTREAEEKAPKRQPSSHATHSIGGESEEILKQGMTKIVMGAAYGFCNGTSWQTHTVGVQP